MKHTAPNSDLNLQAGICSPLLRTAIEHNVNTALAEDLPTEDLSTTSADSTVSGEAQIICREAAVIAGCFWVEQVFKTIDSELVVEWQVHDGQRAEVQQIICTISGKLGAILRGERCALNFLQTLSGTATTVARYVAQLTPHSPTVILDTRKTIPGLRLAQKYAVVCGNGHNHRFHLSDGVLLKDNHIKLYGSIQQAVSRTRERFPNETIEIEVTTLDEVKQALAAKADVIMLDNFSVPTVPAALALIAGQAKVEVSGNLQLNDIQTLSSCGVDYISIGGLTKHLHAIDMSLTVE